MLFIRLITRECFPESIGPPLLWNADIANLYAFNVCYSKSESYIPAKIDTKITEHQKGQFLYFCTPASSLFPKRFAASLCS